MLITLFVLLAACGDSPPPDPANTPEGRLCSRAHSSMSDSITRLYHEGGQNAPEMPKKEEYIAKCVEAGFTEAQAKCLDPKIAGGDEAGCKKELEPVQAKADALNQQFADAMKEGAKKAEEKKQAEAAKKAAAEATEGTATEGGDAGAAGEAAAAQ